LIESGRVEAIYTDAQDRLSRGDDVEWVSFRALCEAHDTRLVIDGRELRSDLGGRLEGYLKALLARQESVEKSHRVQTGKAASAERGRRNGGPRPYGYNQADGTLTLVPAEAEVLRRMRAEVVQGRSLRQIAADLNRDGIKTARGANWSDTRVSQLLANTLYVGYVHYKGTDHKGKHEAVFTAEQWAELQTVLSARRARPGKGRGREPHVHLFARAMLRCGCCGASMIPRRTTNTQGRVYERYRCLGQTGGASPDCTMPSLAREQIDAAVLRYFEHVGLDLEATQLRIAENAEREITQTRAALTLAERQRALADERYARVRRDYQDGKLDAEDWREQRDELRGERDAAAAEVERLAARVEEVAGRAAMLDSEQELLDRLAELRQAVAGRVTDQTTVEGMRAALMRLFSGFTLHSLEALPAEAPPLPDGWLRSALSWEPGLTLVGGLVIEPHPRREMVLGDDKEAAFPQLARTPLEARVRIPASRP
jgi:site-specific DNA recombinase